MGSMRKRRIRGPGSRGALAWLLALAVSGVAACDGGRAASDTTSATRPTVGPPETPVRVLQMNLCNSGRAACYAGGRAVTRAAALVRQHRPDVVSLNEVCRDDVGVLERAIAATRPAAAIASAFRPAVDRPTREPVLCQNGEEFGDAVLALVPSSTAGVRRFSGVYPVQDPSDPEERVWACLELPGLFSACTTHSASTNAAVALEQCRYLLSSVVPGIGRGPGSAPVILGADLNLAAGGSPSAIACLPGGYQRADDDGVQNVVAGPGAEVRSRSVLDMQGTTDHPGLLVDLVVPHR
jgi:endonuclease/exonuclease/phosphatase family metal-dependent hydrolase